MVADTVGDIQQEDVYALEDVTACDASEPVAEHGGDCRDGRTKLLGDAGEAVPQTAQYDPVLSL
jgi:hypothetical protein